MTAELSIHGARFIASIPEPGLTFLSLGELALASRVLP
jgi:hypothetical protein